MKRLKALYNRIKSTEQLLAQMRTGTHSDALLALDTLKERDMVVDGAFKALDFSGANLSKATFATADLTEIIFREAVLEHAYFYAAQLANADFSSGTLTYANFREAVAPNATFDEALCDHANFSRADLTGASFKDADLRHANFWQTTLVGVNLRAANLVDATISDVVCDETTTLPDGSAWHADVNWSVYTGAGT